MTKDELRIYVFDMALGFVAERTIERHIQWALDQASGNVQRAFALLKESEFGLVHGGFCGPNRPKWDWFGGWTSKCECWLPNNDLHNPPDLQLDYIDLIRYVKHHKPKDKQLELF